MDEMKFYKGEKREITTVIRSRDTNEAVVIASAEYNLRPQFKEDIVQSGNCEIEGAEATVLLDLELPKGNYELEVISIVGREEIIDKVLVIIE